MKEYSLRSAVMLTCIVGWTCFVPAPVQAETRSVFVDSNKRTRLFFWHGINDECSVRRGFNVSVSKLPQHGQVTLEKRDIVITDQLINFRLSANAAATIRKCRGKTTTVISVYYTSNRDYRGFDSVSTLNTSANGKSKSTIEHKIAVR